MNGSNKIIAAIAVVFILPACAFAMDPGNLRNYFLSGDYKACIREGEKIIARSSSSRDLDELYYILGLCYLKEGNFLRASDIFEIVIKEYRSSKFKNEARLGLGDSYFMRRNYLKAEETYRQLLKDRPSGKLTPAIYYRLSQTGKRTGDTLKYQEYLSKLKKEFPQSPEALINKELTPGDLSDQPLSAEASLKTAGPKVPPEPQVPVRPVKDISSAPVAKEEPAEIISGGFSVQVGAFSSYLNAKSVVMKLRSRGYSSYISETLSAGAKKIYKVRVGGFAGLQEAKAAEKKLVSLGYPTKIIP